jgi:DNA-binding NarL/FixJ family response regulator
MPFVTDCQSGLLLPEPKNNALPMRGRTRAALFDDLVGCKALFCDVHHIAWAPAGLSRDLHTREDSDDQAEAAVRQRALGLGCRNHIQMKILVIDDHVLIREALQGVLREWQRDAAVLEASDCRQAMQLIEEHTDLELVLLDLNLPDGDGFHVLADVRERYPAISVVVLSASNDRDSVQRALDLGALGFIPKSARRAVMLSALQLVFSGGIYIPPDILVRQELPSPRAEAIRRRRSKVSPSDFGLTQRQLEVLAHMMQGKSNKMICRPLGVTEATVKTHVTAILKALNVSSRIEAVIAVGQIGWKPPGVDGS